MSYKKQELFILREHLSSPPVFWWGSVMLFFQYFFCVERVVMYVTISALKRCSFRIDLQQECSCFIYVICICLHIVVSSTYCVVFLFCCSSSCVPYVASFSGLSFFYCPLGILSRLLERIEGIAFQSICNTIYKYIKLSIETLKLYTLQKFYIAYCCLISIIIILFETVGVRDYEHTLT